MNRLSKKASLKILNKFGRRQFGILSEYNERKNKKLVGGALFTSEQKFWVTSARPSNFGDHLDCRTKLDNWFDENRIYNEENRDYEIRRAQLYIYHGFHISFFALVAKYGVFITYQWLIGRQRYIEILIKNLKLVLFHLEKFFKLFGMENQYLLED